ncbi:ATP-dependent DNA helicase PIF1-like [Monomorium pharaonis]|uniref:ATP-dependent DNA helicase PIF1-like n=1 Tax=Monomorium pharaonis TaxID=307658 RepID=UPI001746FC57|nr:ATP-dependent DNA helicase PIF1-like [Monomorium pharaonis]
MAFTGFAATLLPNGKTTHKTLDLPMPLFADSTSNIKIQSKEAECLKKTDVFIWDEAPMAPRYALEVMDHLLQDLMQNNLKFGDKIVILGGDFRQLLPVQQNVTRSEIVNLSIKFSSLWQHFKIFSLTENMRILRHEQEFANFLLDLGNGTLNDQFNNIEVLLRCVADLNANIVKDTYEEIFKHHQYRLTAIRAILSARNVDVEELNKQVVNLLDESTERVYTNIDTTETTNDIHDINKTILTEYLSTLNPAILPPHKLRLKKYTVIMLIRNLNISEGLYNGTTLLILE